MTPPASRTRAARRGLVDYVGRYRRLATDLNLSVTADGRLRGVSEASRLFLGPLRIPLPGALDAKAYAEQWWEPQENGQGRHRIQVKVIQPQLGLVLVYAGHFDYRLEPYPGGSTAPGYLPGHARPDRWERPRLRPGTSCRLAEGQLVEPVRDLGQPGQHRRRGRRRVPRQPLRRGDPQGAQCGGRQPQLAPGAPHRFRRRRRRAAATPTASPRPARLPTAACRPPRRRPAAPTGARSARAAGRRSRPHRTARIRSKGASISGTATTISTAPAARSASMSSCQESVTSWPGTERRVR